MIKQTYMLFYNKKFNFKPVKSFASAIHGVVVA